MMHAYPAHFDAVRPPRFDRAQVFLRLAVLVLLLVIGISVQWILGILYVGLPITAALLMAQRDTGAYFTRTIPRMIRVLGAVVAFLAWLAFLTDRFPAGSADGRSNVSFSVLPSSHATVGSALLRLVTSIPSALCAFVLWFVAGLLGIVAAITVLARQEVPAGIYDAQRGIVRWIARLFAYHAALVDEYPPFSFESEIEGPWATAA